MGLLDGAADVAGKVTDKAGDIAGKAGDFLDAATGSAKGSDSESKIKFVKDSNISNENATTGTSVAPSVPGSKKPVSFDFGIPTEFIHFGQVHADAGKNFAHDSFNPKDAKKMPSGHAILFRDALEREAILMFAFISSCKVAVQDTTKNTGAIAELGALASNLMGGSNKTAKPDLAKLDTFLDDIKTQAKKVNVADILYKDVHEAGKVLHETRGKYADFCKSLNEFYIKPPKSEGIGAIGDAIGSAAANIPGVGKILAVVQRIATKIPDMYLAAYLELRQSHERLIELSVHSLTLEAIQGSYEKHKLTYPVWFPLDKKDSDEKTFTEKADDKMKDLPDFLKSPAKDVVSPVTGAADDAKGKYDSATGDAYDFAGGNAAAEETPGSATLTAIFAQMSGGSDDTSKETIKSASDAIIDGLNATLEDIGGIPKFLKPVIREVTNANLGLLEDVFKRIMAKGADAAIDSRALLDAGRFHLTNKIVGILTKMVMGAIGDSMPTPNVDVMGQKVGSTKSDDDVGVDIPGGKHFSAKDLLAHQLNEKLGKYIEPILQYAIGDLAGQLEASRKIADKNKAQTMEVLIGRLPWLNALMFRNTFFPMWNLVAEEVFGAIAPPIKGVLKEINSVIKKAKDATDKAEEYNRRAEKVTKDAKKLGDDASNVEVGSSKGLDDINKIKNDAEKGKSDAETETDEGKAKQAERDKAEQEKKALDDFYVKNDKDEKFPVEARKVEGTGIKVDKEIESVLPKTE